MKNIPTDNTLRRHHNTELYRNTEIFEEMTEVKKFNNRIPIVTNPAPDTRVYTALIVIAVVILIATAVIIL